MAILEEPPAVSTAKVDSPALIETQHDRQAFPDPRKRLALVPVRARVSRDRPADRAAVEGTLAHPLRQPADRLGNLGIDLFTGAARTGGDAEKLVQLHPHLFRNLVIPHYRRRRPRADPSKILEGLFGMIEPGRFIEPGEAAVMSMDAFLAPPPFLTRDLRRIFIFVLSAHGSTRCLVSIFAL